MKSLGEAVIENGEFTEGEEFLIETVNAQSSFSENAGQEAQRVFISELAKRGFGDLQKVRNALKEINPSRQFRITERLERENDEPKELLEALLDVEVGSKNRIIMEMFGYSEAEIREAEKEVTF